MAECTKLFDMWARYEQHWTFHHTGQRAKAELALEDCRHDRYDEGIVELRRLLKRGRFDLPEARSPAVAKSLGIASCIRHTIQEKGRLAAPFPSDQPPDLVCDGTARSFL